MDVWVLTRHWDGESPTNDVFGTEEAAWNYLYDYVHQMWDDAVNVDEVGPCPPGQREAIGVYYEYNDSVEWYEIRRSKIMGFVETPVQEGQEEILITPKEQDLLVRCIITLTNAELAKHCIEKRLSLQEGNELIGMLYNKIRD